MEPMLVMTEVTPGAPVGSGVLSLELLGVVSWRRPRLQPVKRAHRAWGVRTAYPPAYERDRALWRSLVTARVEAAGWVPCARARYGVDVLVAAGGRLDLDRVVTAVLDALQAGAAIRDDCLVDCIGARRQRPGAKEAWRTEVRVSLHGGTV